MPTRERKQQARRTLEKSQDKMLKAPFPWFGGKSRVADIVWDRFGDVANYVEPFFGSGAVLLGCHIHGSMRGHIYVTDSPWAQRMEARDDPLAQLPDTVPLTSQRVVSKPPVVAPAVRSLEERPQAPRTCCGATGDAEHVRVGERVAQQGLQDRAREGERAAEVIDAQGEVVGGRHAASITARTAAWATSGVGELPLGGAAFCESSIIMTICNAPS